jgi:hypothetical protein
MPPSTAQVDALPPKTAPPEISDEEEAEKVETAPLTPLDMLAEAATMVSKYEDGGVRGSTRTRTPTFKLTEAEVIASFAAKRKRGRPVRLGTTAEEAPPKKPRQTKPKSTTTASQPKPRAPRQPKSVPEDGAPPKKRGGKKASE